MLYDPGNPTTVRQVVAVEAGAVDPRALAKQLCLIMEGAYVTRHVTGSRQTVDIARRVADLVIDAGVASLETGGSPIS